MQDRFETQIMLSCSTRTLALTLLAVLGLWQSLLAAIARSEEVDTKVKNRWAIALHGGAGTLPRSMGSEQQQLYREALTQALNRGKGILSGGGTALDATEATVRELEDCYLFNAGKGSAFNRDGNHELDASIMDGSTLKSGGVAVVTKLRNPISAARLVMEKTPHLLMAGERAQQLAAQYGHELVDQSYFYTVQRFTKLQKKLEAEGLAVPTQPGYEPKLKPSSSTPLSGDSGTVGCVALDTHGNLAAATSTGGLTGKLPGRVGDSPICGAGNYANKHVAVGGTGKGEEFIRHSIAARVGWLVESGKYDVEQAVNHCLTNVLRRGEGGIIAVDAKGNLVLQSTTQTLPRGAADSSGGFEIEIWFND